MNSTLLVVDTSTEACSVALSIRGVITQRFEIIPRQHTQRIMPMIQDVLSEAGIHLQQCDAIAFGRGPGAFTGLRIAAGIVQGLAYGANLPVIPISTLAALAQGAVRECNAPYVFSAIDARMGEVYWACYKQENGLVSAVNQERVSAPNQVNCTHDVGAASWVGVGTGCEYQAQFALRCTRYAIDRYPRASDMAVLAQTLFANGDMVSAEQAIPVYLRDDVVDQKK